jgi:hypothetical protein
LRRWDFSFDSLQFMLHRIIPLRNAVPQHGNIGRLKSSLSPYLAIW